MEITYYGHACYMVKTGGKSLLFDPFISPNPLAKSIDINTLKPDYILISHGHEDHVADVETIARHSGATLISNFEIISWFAEKGIDKGHPMNFGGKWVFDFGTVKYVQSVHSSTMPDGKSGGHPGGFVVNSDEGVFYYAGDTALTMDMQLIGSSVELDFAMLPIGDNFTMGIDDAVTASNFLKCRKIIGMHYDTFGYIEIDHEEAKRKFRNSEKELILFEIGERREF
jgi:L-ascorbate metabolism protein UlaG (beta-lactamase superfamily)